MELHFKMERKTQFIASAYKFKDAFFPENRFLRKKDLGILSFEVKKIFGH